VAEAGQVPAEAVRLKEAEHRFGQLCAVHAAASRLDQRGALHGGRETW